MSNRIFHRPPKGEKPVASKPTDAAVARPQKPVAPASTHSILGDLARSTFAHLIAGATLVGLAAKKIKDVAEPMIGEARHTYQRLRLEQLRREAQGLPPAFGARLEQLAPDLEKYEAGLNQDALGKDLDEAAVLIGEYTLLGRLPQVEGLADDAPEKYQAAWAKAVETSDQKAMMQLGERHQLLIHVDRLHEYTANIKLPQVITERLGLIMGHVGELDLNTPLGGDETQTQTLAATQNSAELLQLYERTQQEKEFHQVAGAERVAKNNAAWVVDQFENHYEDLWDPETTPALYARASHRTRAVDSAATLAHGHFLTAATRDKMLAALEDKHATTVIRYVESVLMPQEQVNDLMRSLQQLSGFRDDFQLEYKVPGFGIIPVEVMNDNPLSKLYLSWKNSENPNDRKMASRAATAMDWFMDPSRDTHRAAEEIALANEADWDVFARRITYEARELGALESLMGRAADAVPKAKPSAMEQLIAFKARANQALGVGGRKPGHVTDKQLLFGKYEVDSDMLRYIDKNYLEYIPRAAARDRLALFNDETAPLANRRAAATVYEAYLLQQVRNDYRVELQQLVGTTDEKLLDRALDIGRMISRGTHYGYSDFKSIARLQEDHRGTMRQIEPLHHLRMLNETAAQLKEMRETLQEYGGHKSAPEKVEYALYGWVAERYRNVAPEHIGSLLFEIEKAKFELESGDSSRSQWLTGVVTTGQVMKEITALHEEATEVIAYRDTAQDIIIMAAATAATAGVGASLGLAMTGGRWATTAGRVLSTGLRIAGRQAAFLHVNAAGKYVLRGKQDLYDFNKGWRYNAYNVGVQVVEFELMGRFHGGFKNAWKVAESKLPSTATLLKAALDPKNKLKDIAQALGSKAVTFNHGVIRDTIFFHSWTPLGATVRGVAHGDLSEVRASVEELGSAKAFRHTLVFTLGMGMPLGHPLSAHAVKFALKHHLPEMNRVVARQEKNAALETQLVATRDPTRMAQLRHQQFQLAEHNAATMEKLAARFKESDELRQQWQALHSAHLMARFNYANARQVELAQRVHVLEAGQAPVAKRIQALKELEAHAHARAVLTAMIHGNGELPPEAVMATELAATHTSLQRDHAETSVQIDRLERRLLAVDISAPVPANQIRRLLQALRHQVQVMQEINALEPGRFTAEAIAATRGHITTLQAALPPLAGAAKSEADEALAASAELHGTQVEALGAQTQIVRDIAEAEAEAVSGKSEKSRLDPLLGMARHFMEVWQQRGDSNSPARRLLAQALLLPVAPFIGAMGSGGGGPAKGQSNLVTELARGKPELRDWKPGDAIPSLDQLVRTREDVTLLIALGKHRTDVWPLLHTLAVENPGVFTSEHRQKLEAIPHKDPAVESTLERLARRRLDLFSSMTANSVAQLSSSDCARHAAELRLRLNTGKTWEQNTALGEYTLLITHGHLSAEAYRNEAAALINDAAKLAIDSLGRYQAAFETVVSQGKLTHADMNTLVESDRFALPAEWPRLEGKARKRYKNNLKWWITRYGRPLKVFRNGVALPALLMNVGGTPRQIYKLLAGTPYDTDMPFEFQSRDGHTLATQTAQKVFNLNRGGKNLGLEIHISVPELLEFARTHPESIDPATNYISIRGAALPEFQKFVREHAIPVRILIPMELSTIHLPILARHPNIHIQYLSARDPTLTPDAQAKQWAAEAAISSHRADAQALNVRLFAEGSDDAFAAAGARNNFDSGMIFFSPYSPALFFIDAEVDPGTGAIRTLKARSTKKLTNPDPTTIGASVAIFSPWASAKLSELHSKAMKIGLSDSDPVPAWLRTEIGQIVETHAEMSIEGTHITTQFAKWFSFVNSPALTLGAVFSDRVMDIYGKNLPPEIEADLQGALIGKPFRTRRGSPIPIQSKGSADTHGAAPPLSVHSPEPPPRLGIVGVGSHTEYPPLTHNQRPPREANSITRQEFHDAIVDHFHPMHFNDTPLQHRRQGIIDRWTMHEYKIERDIITSARTPVLRATDAFLARTQARSEAFVALLDLRVEAQLRNKFGAQPHLTDMDIEAERNRILAEILSAGLGTYLPIARGKISVSTADGVIVLRPSRAEDYAAIDLAIQSGDNPGEVLTGGFYCHKSALRLPFIVINPDMGDRAFSIFRHELQHLRKHASNRFEPHFAMPTPDAVQSYPEALREHFGIAAKDEILAYLEGATPPRETVATLTKPGGIYDAIAKARDKIPLSDDDIAILTQAHNTYVAHQVWATNEAIADLVRTGWHPEAARRALINSLSDIPFMDWGMQLPMAVSALLAAPPQRLPPPPAAREGQRPELRVWLETEILPNRSKGWKKLDARAQQQIAELSSIAQELRGTVRLERLQELRRHVDDGNSELEQLAEVLQFMTDESRGQVQVNQQRNAATSEEARANAAQWRKFSKKQGHLTLLSGLVTRYLRASSLAKVQERLDRLLLLQTAHSQQLLSDSAKKTLAAPTPAIARPRIQEEDVARMRVEDQLSHIFKLRNAMAQATAPDEVVRAASLYATYVRHGLLTQQMRAIEFEALMDIAQAHPEWMPHLKYAFLGISGTMMPEQWQHILQDAMPVQPAEETPGTTLSSGNKTRALHTIEGYRQQLEASPQDHPHISQAIDALELALRRGEPIPQVVVRYGMLIPDMIDHAILHGASKENMARYFIVKEGQRPPTPNEPWLTVMDVAVPLDRFVRFLMKSTLRLDIDDTHIITTERTNAAFNHFLMHSFVRRHVAVQEGLLTPELVFHAQRGVISLEVRAAPEAKAAQPPRQSIHGMNAIGGALLAMGGGEQLLHGIWSTALATPDAAMLAGGVVMAGVAVGAMARRLYQRHIAAQQLAPEAGAQHPDDHYLASIPTAEAEALRTIPQEQWHLGYYDIVKAHQRIRELAQRLEVPVDPETLAYMAKRCITWRMKTVENMFIGSFDTRETLQAAVHQYKLMKELFGTTPANINISKLGGPRHIPISDHYEIAIYEGTSEASLGIDFRLINKASGKTIATIGMQETNDALEVVRYQGGQVTQSMRGDFIAFSGGVDPMPWVSYVVGRILLQRAQATGKELRWTAGERARSTYPHLRAETYEAKTIEEARAFWGTPNPELDAMAAEYDVAVKRRSTLAQQLHLIQRKLGDGTPTLAQQRRLGDLHEELGLLVDLDERYLPALMWHRGPRTQALYDRAAHNLGFMHHAGSPWHRFTDPQKFGKGILDGASDPQKFNASAGAAAKALSVLRPFATEINYSGFPFVAEMVQQVWDSALAQLRKHLGANLATRANDHRSEIDEFLTQMGITPSALELETFLGGGGLDIRLDLLTPYVEQLKLLPQALLTQLFTHQLLHPQMLRTLETSGAISRHGFEPTLRLLATLTTGTPTDKERQLQAMGYSAEGAREIVDTLVHHLPFGVVDILSLILPHSAADAIAALRMAKDSTGNFSRYSLRQASTILKDSAQAGISLSPDELKYMTSIQATSRTDMVVTNSLNAVDRMMTMESLHFRYELLRRLYGDTHAIPEHNQAAVATVPLNDRYTLKLETGVCESACGMQVTLYERDPVQGELELGSIGFQESSAGIEVVGYQGADLSQSQRTDSATQFRAFSGGVDPMPWLAVLTGQTLLTQASTQGKTLRWIAGERIKMGYPHLKGMSPPHITSVQDARGPWDGHPQHAAIMAEYDALIAAKPKTPSDIARRDQRLKKVEDYVKVFRAGERRTAKLYDATAQNLGFRRKGNDAAWHRYTKDPAEFGSAILSSRDVDRERVQASLQATHAAIRADEKFNLWATSPQRPPKRIFPAQHADQVTLEDFMGILFRDFGDEHFPHEDLRLARNEIGDHLLATEDRMDQIYDAARAKTKDPVTRQRLATDQFLVRTRARTDVFLRILELRVQSKLRSQFGGDAAITELDQEAALRPIIVEIFNEAFSGPPMPALKGHIDITDRDGVLVLRPAHPDDFAALRNVIANRMDTNQNLPFGFFNANSALGIPVLVISPECSEEAWVILRHEFDHFLKFASNRFERGAFPPLADNLMSDGKLNPAAQTRYMNGMRDYLFKIAKDETLAHLTNVRAPRDVLADLTRVGGQYDFIAIVKAELAERIASGVGGTTVSVGHQDPMTAQDYALSRIDTMRARHDQGITKNIWLLYDAVETLVDHGYHPETARLTLIHALTPVPYTNWPTQLPKIIAQLAGQPARTLLPESLDPQDHHFRLRRWIERDNPALAEVKALIDDHTAAIEKTQGELAQPASAARLQQLRQEWRHQISEPQQLLEVLHLMLGELECRREVMQRRGNNLPEVIRLTAKIDHFKLLIDTAKTQGQLTAMKLLKLQTTIDKQLRVHSAHVQTKIQGGTVRNSMSAMGALAMADLGVGLHQAWLSVADTVATHPYALTAAAAAIVGATLFASRFTESGRLRNVIKTLGIKDLIKARAAHPEDPILSLNAFLRGELGREPTLAEVRTFEQHTWEYRERAAIYGREVPGELQILQIYNKEFVDALAARITATAQEFRRKQGRDPVIVEIAAGDGRLSRALRRRGIMITATDAHEWHSGGSNDVEDHVPWAMAMRRGDIILGSWLPAAQDRGPDDFDVPIARHLIEHPDKTFIQIEAACTNTRRFKDFVSAEQQKGALFIDEPPEFAELLTSRLGNNTPLDHEDELTALLVPRGDNRTHLRIYRGTEERLPAFLGIPSVLPAHGGMSQIHYSGAPFIADLAKQAVAGVLNFFGVGHPTATPLPVKPSDKPAAAVPAYIPPHWKDLMPGKLDFGHPIWLQHVDSALADAGSYQNAYRHMMHNAFATRWDAHHTPTKFNFDTDPWTNSRFLTALRAVRHRMAAELAANHFVGIDTADHQMSRYTFKSLGEFDAFVVTELQRIRDSEIPPASPALELDPQHARIFSVRDILSGAGKTVPLLHIEGVSIPREFKEGDRVEIGRDGANNDISFPTDDLVSRAHAVIVFERRGEFIGRVTDLLSANATKVIRDGVTTTLRDGEQFKLKVGDCVQVGSQRIYVGEPPPRSKPGDDPHNIAPTSVVPIRFREHEAQWREEYHPRTRDMDHIWRVRKNEEGGRQRLVDIFRANALRDPSQRRWPINFVVQAKPGAPDDSLVRVGQRFWPGQTVPEAGVKHIQIANGEYAQWAGELRGIFDAQGQLVEVQFNASSGEFGQQSLNASQDEDIRIVRHLLAKILHIEATRVRFVR